jgi:hypothetical protein
VGAHADALFLCRSQGRGQRQAAGQQRELMKQLTSGGGGLSGGVSVQEVPSSPKTSGAPASHHKKAAPDAPSSASHNKRSSQAQDRHIVKKRKLQMHPPLDIKEYLELDAERGIAQRGACFSVLASIRCFLCSFAWGSPLMMCEDDACASKSMQTQI